MAIAHAATQCSFRNGQDKYDFSALANPTGYSLKYFVGYFYYWNICETSPGCLTLSPNAVSCVTSQIYGYLDNVTITALPDPNTQGAVITYQGDLCPHEIVRTTRILLQCSDGDTQFVSFHETTTCVYEIVMTSKYACPINGNSTSTDGIQSPTSSPTLSPLSPTSLHSAVGTTSTTSSSSSSSSTLSKKQQQLQQQQINAIDPTTPEGIKQKCESNLQLPDSIMSIDVAQTMKDYITNGGSPPDVIRLLSENYRGYAQMCNLLCDWLSVTGMSKDAIQSTFKSHLKDIIMEKFDPKKADTIFSSSPPQWLDEMITDPDWRSLIYQLSEIHKNCLMLNFAIQKISDAGYQNEIASLSTASTYFSVFNKVLLDSLIQLIKLDEIELQESISEFKKTCCNSQHTYLYAQALIHNLSQTYPNLKRIAQELELEVFDKSKVARKISLMMSNISSYPAIYESISSILSSNTASTGDIIKLYNEYSKPNVPPVEFLRIPALLELLLNDLFNPTKNLQQNKSKWIYIVAFCVSVPNTTTSLDSIKEELNETIRAIDKVQSICQSNPLGSELQNVVPILKEYLELPIISMGILQWIQSNLMNKTNISSYNTLCTPVYFEFLREICLKHPLHRQVILRILVNFFELETDLDALAALEMRKTIIDNIVFIFCCGYVIPVLNVIRDWAPKIDPSLVRYFINQVIEMIEPPYSKSFIKSMTNIIEIVNPHLSDNKENVQTFLDQ
ncbi:TH1 family protein [Heterostelium album PN500]|uniref:TH1 family protein n=1 Tax=Heterostelium pallidum (strain ATCC 26659 / Pp 5 / PN500) TaxID=670386 RepID=D3BTJ5_HETP5|nr:TH1 family protein [Heterostelium album PN500]EFA75412.1 TH1 family protein [Heterostelium album PN500]|eukprot:XP_020427546.1 TH1 family protein [Heterostelium album PN500]